MNIRITSFAVLLFILLSSCWARRYETSNITGWDYNVPEGGFQKVPFEPMETPPEMALVEGESLYEYSELRKRFKIETGDSVYLDSFVSSFFVSKYEETNFQYRHFLNYLKRTGQTEEYEKSLPDTTVWLKCELPEEKSNYLMNNYFQNSLFDLYPVVGLSSGQILKYARWKTDRLNEAILIREGILTYSEDSANLFTTEKYLNNQYEAENDILVENSLNPNKKIGSRRVRMEDGILLPRMRLMTEKEWKWAVLCIGNNENKYLVTPKEYKQKKMDKENHFPYLYLPKEKTSTEEIIKVLVSLGLTPVNEGSKNSYEVFNLNNNVSEFIYQDSLRITNEGGSWKFPGKECQAIYQFKHKDSLNYFVPNEFQLKQNLSSKPTAFIGFRLAMDYIGPLFESEIKRK